jgi:hypothetical protein
LIERYTRPAMGRIWTEDTKYRCWLEVEVLGQHGSGRGRRHSRLLPPQAIATH